METRLSKVLRSYPCDIAEHLSDTKNHLKMDGEWSNQFPVMSLQQCNIVLDDERLSLADDLKKAHDHNQNKSK
ncbi:hypothetical protein Tco_1517324 [Tanacetum coccineum]